MHKAERDIFFYDLKPISWHRKYPSLAPYPHYDMAKALRTAFQAGRAEYIRKTNGQSIYISDLLLAANRCEMLIGFSDTVAADPTLNNRPTRQRRIVKKAVGEGVEHSAHVLWVFGDAANADLCPFFIERANGLGSAVVARFLNRLLRLEAATTGNFTRPDPSGAATGNTFKTVKVRPQVGLLGHPSKELLKDLKNGSMTELELYSESSRATPWDSNSYAIEEHRGVVIRPNKTKLLPKAKAWLDGVINGKVKSEYEYARLKFKTESGIARAVNVLSDGYRLVTDNGYVRKEKIEGIGLMLPNAFDKFHMPIINRMRTLANLYAFPMLRILLSPLNYLWVSRKGKFIVDWLIPIVLAMASCAVLFRFGGSSFVASKDGLVDRLQLFCSVLPGFYIAALAAIATFGNAEIDQIMPNPTTTLVESIRGSKVKIDLTRRRFLALLFAFLCWECIALFALCILIALVGHNIVVAASPSLATFLTYGGTFVLLTLFWQLICCTFLGLYYLGIRLHQPTV